MDTVGNRVIMKSTTGVEMPIRWPVGEVQGGQLPRAVLRADDMDPGLSGVQDV